MAPLILLLIVGVMMLGMIGSALTNVANGGIISYSEEVFQDYANQEYYKAFGNSGANEDNILIVVLTNEEKDGYYCIAWVGDNIQDKINLKFGDDTTAFGQSMIASVNDFYAYSLDSNLAMVMNTMTEEVQSLGLPSSFKKEYSHEKSPASHLVNYTDLSLTEETVNDALVSFTEATMTHRTGIRIRIASSPIPTNPSTAAAISSGVSGKWVPFSSVTGIPALGLAIKGIP